jgi:hypothetical protein
MPKAVEYPLVGQYVAGGDEILDPRLVRIGCRAGLRVGCDTRSGDCEGNRQHSRYDDLTSHDVPLFPNPGAAAINSRRSNHPMPDPSIS